MALLRKSVLITGCSAGGIGAALAEVFHEKGYHVFATARNPSKIPQALSSSANVTALKLDVLSSESIAAAAEDVKRETGGKLDVLINNSGGGYYAAALDTSIEEAKKLYDLHVWAPLSILQAFAPQLIEAKGCLVNNSSISAYIPMAFGGAYNGSKAALVAASETWRYELQPLGVRTITLITCATKTQYFNNVEGAKIPETSKYYEVRGLVHGLTDGHLQAGAISARQYATKVVREVEKGTVGTVWAGTNALINRLTLWLSPQLLMDMVLESIVPVGREMAKVAQRSKA
ncbi:hypothetical protein MGN70_005654 [Eutypa lata]|uniref:Putative short-chain dehydrogenase protein n=1 Tax=Eutypa lata (strain UCR-EL1) TaxID=1287681 RepID=M7TJM7_EUTLA|nr:putative short-chain dehydrogenase protein [Eutypa lata UCREL1]KAI1253446.1 hypothetical protein MGN70_005654 [Eutypa lata]